MAEPKENLRLALGPQRDVYTVTRLNREVRELLERGFRAIWIEGEISNLARPSSGHWYFSLKDKSSQVRCAMFRQSNRQVGFTPSDGMQAIARAKVGLYEPRGEYQLVIDHLEEAGEGRLRREFEMLKKRLFEQGLFDPEHKRSLPTLPRRVGVITSPSGAAIRDILHVLGRRFPAVPVLVYPVPVQGAESAARIAAAVSLASSAAVCEVLILARGGGSLEDLWSFNEEIVARAIFDCQIPVVTGIGHEIDFTIADFVADLRAPTPSGAAELVVPDSDEWLRLLLQRAGRLRDALYRLTRESSQRLRYLHTRLARLHPGQRLRQHSQRLDELEQRMQRGVGNLLAQFRGRLAEQSAHLRRLSPADRTRRIGHDVETLSTKLITAMNARIQDRRHRLDLASTALAATSPDATLARGYAIVTRDEDGTLIRDSDDVRTGERIRARLARGELSAEVTGRSSSG